MRQRLCFVAGAVAITMGLGAGAHAVPSAPERLTNAEGGGESDGFSMTPHISGNGRYVAFSSDATNLTSATPYGWHAYVHDRQQNDTYLVSVDDNGNEGNDQSWVKGVTNDGDVLFDSYADNLVGSDTNSAWDVFLHDLSSGNTTLLSKSDGGTQGDADSYGTSISADGDRALFWSAATNLDSGSSGAASLYVRDRSASDTTLFVNFSSTPYEDRMLISGDGETIVVGTGQALTTSDTDPSYQDVFAIDVSTGTRTLLSVSPSGASYPHAYQPHVSYSGRYVVWSGDEMTTGDSTTGSADVYLRDRTAGTTEIVSLSTTGTQEQEWMGYGMPSVSNDGQYVLFHSAAALTPEASECCGTNVFLRDTVNDTTARLNEPSGGGDPDGGAEGAWIAGGDEVAVFTSWASNLDGTETVGLPDVFEVEL